MHQHIETVVIGAGQAGLATSYYLNQANKEHVIFEKDRVGEAWRSGKWDSFTLVTPNWMFQLPGLAYQGDQPEGFFTRDQVVQFLDDYVEHYALPVREGVSVMSVSSNQNSNGFELQTSQGTLHAANVIVACGTFQKPKIPALASNFPSNIMQLHSSEYKNPDLLPSGAVLIVGSAQSGCQIADELNANGREVYLCTGKANWLPRQYRGKDSFWWADQLGIFDQTVADLPSPDARFQPNPQVSGKGGGKTLNLHILANQGIHLLGRLQAVNNGHIFMANDLNDHIEQADEFADQFKKGVDNYIENTGMELPQDNQEVSKAAYAVEPPTELDLNRIGITTVIWATGYSYDYSWIKFPILDKMGYPIQERGVTNVPGLYFIGLNWLHTRQSALLSGVGDDAKYVTNQIMKTS